MDNKTNLTAFFGVWPKVSGLFKVPRGLSVSWSRQTPATGGFTWLKVPRNLPFICLLTHFPIPLCLIRAHLRGQWDIKRKHISDKTSKSDPLLDTPASARTLWLPLWSSSPLLVGNNQQEIWYIFSHQVWRTNGTVDNSTYEWKTSFHRLPGGFWVSIFYKTVLVW